LIKIKVIHPCFKITGFNMNTQPKKLKICFVALHKPLLAMIYDKNYESAGGAELQQLNLANYLKSHGVDVSLILNDTGANYSDVDGFKIYTGYPKGKGIPFLRFFYPRLYRLNKTMKKINADVYYIRTRGGDVGLVAYFAKKFKKKSIFSVSHDYGINLKYFENAPFIEKKLYRYGLKNCDLIIVQSTYQKDILLKNFKREGKILTSGHKIIPKIQRNARKIQHNILWVSTLRSVKQPEVFIKLAEAFPQIKFTMIGDESDDKKIDYNIIKKKISKLKNLNYKGYIQPDKVQEYFNSATIFVNTSKAEGFPNTFCQAWLASIPVASLKVDPDNIITKHKLGYVGEDFNGLKKGIQQYLDNPKRWFEDGIRCRQYVEKNHNIESVGKQFHNMVSQLIEGT